MKQKALLIILIFTFLYSSIIQAATYEGECLGPKGKFKKCQLDFDKNENLVVTFKSEKYIEFNQQISGKSIKGLTGGEYARRRVGESIGTAIALGPLGLFMLFSKKKRAQFGVEYERENGKMDSFLFQVKKKYGLMVGTSLKSISGLEIDYGGEEEKKSKKEKKKEKQSESQPSD